MRLEELKSEKENLEREIEKLMKSFTEKTKVNIMIMAPVFE